MRDVWKIGLLLALLASPAWAIYSSTFQEGTGSPPYVNNTVLEGHDGWTKVNGQSGHIYTDVLPDTTNGTLQITPTYTTNGNRSDIVHNLDASDPTGVTTVDIDMYVGLWPDADHEGNMWSIYVDDGTNQLAWWYGGPHTASCRIASDATAIPDGITGTGPTTLRAVINAATGETSYYYDRHDGNGMQPLATKTGYTGTSSVRIMVEAWNYTGQDWNDTWAFFDNLNVPEPATLVLLGLGGLLFRRRR